MISQYQLELAEASYSSQISGVGLTGWFSFQVPSTSNKKHQYLSPSYFLRGMDVLLHVCLGPIPKRNFKKTSSQPNKCSSERLYPKSRTSIHPHHHIHWALSWLQEGYWWDALAALPQGGKCPTCSSYHFYWQVSAVADPSILDAWLMHWAIFYAVSLDPYPGRKQGKPNSMQYPGNISSQTFPWLTSFSKLQYSSNMQQLPFVFSSSSFLF